jgi:cytochrome c peroxidase
MAVEGLFRHGTSEPKGYAHHLARDPNRTRISMSLNAPLDLTHDAAVIVHFDLANLLNAPRPLSFQKDGAATHSREGSISCASCHHPDAAFTEKLPVSIGIDGTKGDRNSMPLFNLAWKREFFWNGRAPSLREQVLMPIKDHREMDESLEDVSAKLTKSPDYTRLFGAAFRSEGITAREISVALDFDQAISGKTHLTEQETRGFELFMTEYEPRTGQLGADCFHCHGGALFSDHQFHNNGLAGDDPGRAKVTGSTADHGKFSTPSLRNIALTAPYMHDGRFATLEKVIEHCSSGIQRGPTLDPNLAKHPASGLNLDTADKAALLAFLKTLTSAVSPAP